MTTIKRHIMHDGSLPSEKVASLFAQTLVDEAALFGKQLTNIAQVFDGTVALARETPGLEDFVPAFIEERDVERLSILVLSADVVEAS
jgi:hypothetical protein